ncbi:hypothetical protein EXN66_Car008697 [Channa argus]|uniref:Uncharacterized protein n=1 Tax=Channa argus TaxID=215402 RepID=A0A6G1PRQ5_CHAAH|nr:hypothetical protein EXN66_Car008697 [Channa argus]
MYFPVKLMSPDTGAREVLNWEHTTNKPESEIMVLDFILQLLSPSLALCLTEDDRAEMPWMKI